MWMFSSLHNKRVIDRRRDWTREQVLAYQRRRFRNLIRYVWDNSPFYRELYANHGVRGADIDDLTVADLPIIGKELLMENFDRISHDPALRRNLLESWIHSAPQSERRYRGRFVVLHTSGSSGTLGIFVYNKHAWTRIRGLSTRAARVRVNPFDRVRLAWYGASHGRFAGVTTCRTLPSLLCVTHLCSVLDPLPKTIEALNRFRPDYLIGYAAAIHELADAALAGKLDVHPQFVATGGEVITEAAIAAIASAWGVVPTNTYGTSESLCLGLQLPGQDVVTLMEDENIIEMLDDNDTGVAPGEDGRVVITALYNRAIPIVRYDLRDTVTRGKRAATAPFDHILRLNGRVEDALPITLDDGTTDTIHPVVLSEFFVPGIRKFQFVSESPAKLILRFVADDDISPDVGKELGKILALKGAAEKTKFRLQREVDLPPDPGTGKRRLVVLPRSCLGGI